MSVTVKGAGNQVAIVTNQEGTERVLASYSLEDLEALATLGTFKRPATDRLLRGVTPWRAWRKTSETAGVVSRKLRDAGWVPELVVD